MSTAKPILVVDDDAEVRTQLRSLLENQGFRVIDAADGDGALAAQRRHGAALMITDIVMPNKEGIETIRDFQKHHPEVKIIAMSDRSGRGSSYLHLAAALGAHRTLAKPFSARQMLDCVRELLPGRGD
ncbi:MAG: response regulator [Thermodesulfobacteriota bacterium]